MASPRAGGVWGGQGPQPRQCWEPLPATPGLGAPQDHPLPAHPLPAPPPRVEWGRGHWEPSSQRPGRWRRLRPRPLRQGRASPASPPPPEAARPRLTSSRAAARPGGLVLRLPRTAPWCCWRAGASTHPPSCTSACSRSRRTISGGAASMSSARTFPLCTTAMGSPASPLPASALSPPGTPPLLPSLSRVRMCQLATADSPMVMVDSWEASQSGYSRTLVVLEHVEAAMAGMRGPGGESVRVMLLCGADLLHSFVAPGVWRPEHVAEIAGERHGVVCVARPGAGGDVRRRARAPKRASASPGQPEGATPRP
mmetsp:Transcript_47521/g.152246  ORF Transcript_47521/g.152246 Transcript_47521/m.152246 type:complete len:311 (+) Transcript_47521:88-1020(+)